MINFRLIIFTALYCTLFTAHPIYAIVGGRPVLSTNDGHPASFNTVAIARRDGNSEVVFCSGSLIGERFVLTARHCTVNRDSSDLFVIFNHITNKASQDEIIPVEKKYEYQGVDKWEIEFPNHDIAILELKRSAPSSYRPLNIASMQSIPQDSQPMVIAGFGNRSPDQGQFITGENYYLDVTLFEYLDSPLFRHQLHLRSPEGSGGCHGDSGGPAYQRTPQGQWLISGVAHGFDLAITTGTLVERDDEDFPLIAHCDAGEIIYGFTGPYLEWINHVTDLELEGENYQRRKLNTHDFTQLCETSYPEDGHWPTLKTLALKASEARISEETEKDVLESCQRIEEILNDMKSLSFEKYDQLGDLRPLIHFPHFESLSFNNIEIDQLHFDDLAKLIEKKNITLDWRQFTLNRANLENLKPLVALMSSLPLEKINLNFNTINNLNGIEQIGQTGQLKHLHLNSNQLSSLPSISKLKNLESLLLRQNNLEGSFSTRLFSQLKKLDLSVNRLSRVDIPTSSLEFLNLSSNPMTEISLSTQPNLNYLSLSETKNLSSQNLNSISQSTFLKELHLNNCGITDIKFLSKLKHLRNLSLAHNQIENIDVFSNTSFPKLQRLAIGFNQLTDLTPLINLESLRTLWPQGNPLNSKLCPKSQGPSILKRFCQRL